MQSTTRKLAAHIQQALLALPDDVLFETLTHWIDTLKQRYDDLEGLADYSEALGYRVSSVASGKIYESVEALNEMEPEAGEVGWIAPEPSTLREVVRRKQPKEIYHQIVVLAGEALRETGFALRWGEPPGEQNDGYRFMRCLQRYLMLRKEAGNESTEQFEELHEEQLEALANSSSRGERSQRFEDLSECFIGGHAAHFRVVFSELEEQRHKLLLQALSQYDCTIVAPTEGNALEVIVSYAPGQRQDLKTLSRIRRLLTRWQRSEWITLTERKEKPPKRFSQKKQKKQKKQRSRRT